MDEKPEEKVDTQALVNAIIWTGLLLGAAALALIVVITYQTNQAAKRANINDSLARTNGAAPGPDGPSIEDVEKTEAA